MKTLVNDIKQLAGRYKEMQVSDPRFLSMLRDVHDFRYNVKLNRLLGILYKEGTIQAVTETSAANLRSIISILSDNVHRKHTDFAEADVAQVLNAFAIAVDIITLEEYCRPVVKKTVEPQRPVRTTTPQHKPTPLFEKGVRAESTSTSWWYVIYIVGAFLASLWVSRYCMLNFGMWQGLCYVSGDILLGLLLIICPKKWKPSAIDSVGFTLLLALSSAMSVKSLLPLFSNLVPDCSLLTIAVPTVIWAALSVFGLTYMKLKNLWHYLLGLVFFIGCVIGFVA